MTSKSFVPRKRQAPVSSGGSPFLSPGEMGGDTPIKKDNIDAILKTLNDLLRGDGIEIIIPSETYAEIKHHFLYTLLYEFYDFFSKYGNIRKRCAEWLRSGSFGGKLVIDVSTHPTTEEAPFCENKKLDSFLKENMYADTTMLDLDSHTYSFTIFLSNTFFAAKKTSLKEDIMPTVIRRITEDNPDFMAVAKPHENFYSPFTYCAHQLIGRIIYHAYCNHVYRTEHYSRYSQSTELLGHILTRQDFNTDMRKIKPSHKRGFVEILLPNEDELVPEWATLSSTYCEQLEEVCPDIEENCERRLKDCLGTWRTSDKPFYVSYANSKIASTSKSANTTAAIDILMR
ncbi:MAG: hypothetical protein Q4D57_01840 [Clostridia bacterium]|nr:hypothetical protein [Clostridia bacterium]